MKSIQRIDEALQIYHTKSSDKYAHIDAADIQKVGKLVDEKQKWYDQTANAFNAIKPHENPTVLCSKIKQEREVRYSICLVLQKCRRKLFSKLDFLGTRTRILGYFEQAKTKS